MFRQSVNEVGLTRTKKPSMKPAVEALEERVVLTAAPTSSALAQAAKLLQFQLILRNTITRQAGQLGAVASVLVGGYATDPIFPIGYAGTIAEARRLLNAMKSTLYLEATLLRTVNTLYIHNPAQMRGVRSLFLQRHQLFVQMQAFSVRVHQALALIPTLPF